MTRTKATKRKDWEYDVLVKVLVVGNSGSGKSCLLLRHSSDSFTDSHMATIGVDYSIKTETRHNKLCKIQVWDTAGQERFRSITAGYYRGAQGIIVVYDVTNEDSFNGVENWFNEIKLHASENACAIIVGNKIDLVENRVVSTERGQELAQRLGVSFIETSAKTAQNVQNAFDLIVDKVFEAQNILVNTAPGEAIKPGVKIAPNQDQPHKKRSCC